MTRTTLPTTPFLFDDERSALLARIAELEAAQAAPTFSGVDPLEVMAMLSPLAERIASQYPNAAEMVADGTISLVTAAMSAIPDHGCRCEGECAVAGEDFPAWEDWHDAIALVLRAMRGDETFPLDARQFLRIHARDEVFA